MKLVDLEPQFLKVIDDRSDQYVDDISQADGLWLLCPVCFKANSGPIGTHGIICWRPHVPQTRAPIPGRWEIVGTGYHDLSLVAGSSSVLLSGEGGCKAHFFVRNGEIVMC